MTQRICEAFDSYLDRIGLADSGEEQVRELRRAFFAGCWEILCAILETGGDDVSEPEGIARLRGVRRAGTRGERLSQMNDMESRPTIVTLCGSTRFGKRPHP
jgi:hypothetical protein